MLIVLLEMMGVFDIHGSVVNEDGNFFCGLKQTPKIVFDLNIDDGNVVEEDN